MVNCASHTNKRLIAEITLAVVLGALLSLNAGQDSNWDLRNYHLYNAFAAWSGRTAIDFFPADKHSSLNPLFDFFYAGLALGPFAHFPRLLACIMGGWYAGLVVLSVNIVRSLLLVRTEIEVRILVPIVTLTAVTGAMTFSQIGTTSNDLVVADFILGGILLALQAVSDPFRGRRKLMIAGVLFGVAAGGKLTALTFLPALTLSFFLAAPIQFRIKATLYFLLGWAGGFIAAWGWWATKMWAQFKNPVFPLMNGFFRSPLGPQLNLNDVRFLPHTLAQWLFYPFYWAFDKSNHLVFETDFRDPRLACAYLCLVALGLRAAYQWRQRFLLRHSPIDLTPLERRQRLAIFFLCLSYAAWLCTTSILRYAIVLEVLSVVVAAIAILRLVKSDGARLTAILTMCFSLLAITVVPEWGHTPFKQSVFEVDMSWVESNTLILGVYEPVAYLAAFVDESKHAQFAGLGFISFLHGWPLGDQGETLVREHRGPIVVLFREERRPFLMLLRSVGLSSEVKNCHIIRTNVAPADSPDILACETRLL